MKYNLIFKEKRKKTYFFTNLKYLLNLISFFDFADFQLLKFFKSIFLGEKYKNNKFCILIFLKNFFILRKLKTSKKIKNLNLPKLKQLCYFINRCVPFIKYTFKIPIITLKIFFLMYFQHNNMINFNSNIDMLLKNNLSNNIILLKKYFNYFYFSNFFEKDIKMYIYFIMKISKKFKYDFLDIFELRSFFFRCILHNNLQKYLKENIINIYIY